MIEIIEQDADDHIVGMAGCRVMTADALPRSRWLHSDMSQADPHEILVACGGHISQHNRQLMHDLEEHQ